ncbi:MAG: DUF3842 family protein [Clostridia bacterium]|nr:DUF3842 family protein [Clostridia bacterium]
MKKKVLIIDGQGGRMGKMIAERLVQFDDLLLTVVGTNSIATSAMMKSGVTNGATGENPVVVLSRDADVIVGPVGIVMADSMLGEITPKMASAVSESRAEKVLIPVAKCRTHIAGVKDMSLSALVDDAVQKVIGAANED